MTLLHDFVGWLWSFSLLAGAFLTIWVCAALIGEQNRQTGADENIRDDWAATWEAFRHNITMIRDHLRKRNR